MRVFLLLDGVEVMVLVSHTESIGVVRITIPAGLGTGDGFQLRLVSYPGGTIRADSVKFGVADHGEDRCLNPGIFVFLSHPGNEFNYPNPVILLVRRICEKPSLPEESTKIMFRETLIPALSTEAGLQSAGPRPSR